MFAAPLIIIIIIIIIYYSQYYHHPILWVQYSTDQATLPYS
jgi:hypothetical protein